jgi:CubicO group peptidase (beta-lactamase class C family)
MRGKLVALVSAGVLLVGPGHAFALTDSAPDYAAIDGYVQAQVDANRLPGVALAVVEGDAVAHAQGFGHDAQGQLVTPRTPFMIGSNSKSFTALAVMQLAEAGRLDLDTPLQHYVPEFRLADGQATDQITVRHLLTQRSGLPVDAAGEILLEFRRASFEDALAALRGVHLRVQPGSAYEYSNANYLLLGVLIESVSGQSYAMYVQQHILSPLRMTHTRLQSGDAVGYRFWFGVPVPDPMPYTAGFASVPTGGVVTTAEDMSRYLAMYLNHGRFEDSRLVSPEGLAEMQRGVSRVTFQEGDRTIVLDYAMGWAVGDIAGVPAVYHTGGSPQFSSWMVLIPARNQAFVSMTNAQNWIPGPGIESGELIPKGVMLLLNGQTPTPSTTLPTMYLVLDALAAGLLLVQAWSLWRVLRRARDRRRDAVPLVWEVGLPLGVLLGFPGLYEVRVWSHVLAYTPDLGVLALLVSGVWLATAAARVLRMAHSAPARSAERPRPRPRPVLSQHW